MTALLKYLKSLKRHGLLDLIIKLMMSFPLMEKSSLNRTKIRFLSYYFTSNIYMPMLIKKMYYILTKIQNRNCIGIKITVDCAYTYQSFFIFLLRTYSEIENDNIIYCQGYYDVTVNDLDTFLECGQAGKIGLHAWLEVNDSVVDVSIKQIENERIYKFKEKPFYVLGKVPEGIEYNGFRETHSCAKKIR